TLTNLILILERLRKHIEQITPLSKEEFDYIQTFFTKKRVRKRQYLIHEGDEVKHEFLVLSGLYKVFFVDKQGKEFIMQFAKESWWISDYASFFRQMKATVFIQCVEEGEVLSLSFESREKLSAECHKMDHFHRMKLTNGYVALQQRIKFLLSSTPQERYEAFILMYPDFMQRLPKKMIA